MRSLAATAVAIGLSAVLAAGCGQQKAAGSGGTGPKVAARCVKHQGAGFTVTDRDNGKSFCSVTGTGVFVVLHGSPANMWGHIRTTSAALQPRPNGRLALEVGATRGSDLCTPYCGANHPLPAG